MASRLLLLISLVISGCNSAAGTNINEGDLGCCDMSSPAPDMSGSSGDGGVGDGGGGGDGPGGDDAGTCSGCGDMAGVMPVGSPMPFATNQESPSDIALLGSDVYWTNFAQDGTGTVMKLANTGGPSPTPIADHQNGPFVLAVTAGGVFWGNYLGGEVMELLSGNPVHTVLPTFSHVTDIAADASYIYWIDGTGIKRVPINGNTADPAWDLTNQSPIGCAIDATNIYWTNGTKGTIVSASIGGGTPMNLDTGKVGPSTIAVDGSDVFYSTSSAVFKVATSGGTSTPIASSLGYTPTALAVDANYVYWAALITGNVARAPRAGGSVQPVVPNQDHPVGLAVDGTYVYFSLRGQVGMANGSVQQVMK